MADLEQLELLGLTNSITQELVNHTGLSDSTLAEFLIHLHTTSSDLTDFKSKCREVGAEFPDSFLDSVDRLVLSMHPKYKLKKAKSSKKLKGKGKGKADATDLASAQAADPEKEKAKRLFPGLSLPDQEWKPTTEYDGRDAPKLALDIDNDQPVDVRGAHRDATNRDEADLGIDGLMKELEGVSKKRSAHQDSTDRDRDQDRSMDGKRQRQRSPDYDRRDRDRNGDRDRGRSGYGHRGGDGRDPRIGGVGPNRLDEKPVLYKIYPGKVTNIKDFGCFVGLEGIVGRQEGELLPSFSLACTHQ